MPGGASNLTHTNSPCSAELAGVHRPAKLIVQCLLRVLSERVVILHKPVVLIARGNTEFQEQFKAGVVVGEHAVICRLAIVRIGAGTQQQACKFFKVRMFDEVLRPGFTLTEKRRSAR
jgi:hypothetical protein